MVLLNSFSYAFFIPHSRKLTFQSSNGGETNGICWKFDIELSCNYCTLERTFMYRIYPHYIFDDWIRCSVVHILKGWHKIVFNDEILHFVQICIYALYVITLRRHIGRTKYPARCMKSTLSRENVFFGLNQWKQVIICVNICKDLGRKYLSFDLWWMFATQYFL